MKKFKVLFTQNCNLETTIIVEGDFPEDEDERWVVITELASEEFMKDNGTDRLIMGNCMETEVKELGLDMPRKFEKRIEGFFFR